MRQLKELARLRFGMKRSLSETARSLGVARSSVQEAVRRFAAAKLSWPLDEKLDDAAMYELLYGSKSTNSHLAEPDWNDVMNQLRGKGMTRRLLWKEYVAEHQERALGYAQYCAKLSAYAGGRDVSLRIQHQPGESMFVDYAGMTVEIQDRESGERRSAQVFVASLGYSHAIYVDATWSQSIPDWLSSMTASLNYFGGVPHAVVPDNLKSAVTKASRYEPEIQASFAEWAAHYGTAILPSRVASPDDKAKVENAVRIVEQQILAVLRKQPFFSLAELNAALSQRCEQLNRQAFQKREGYRWAALLEERSAMKPLPAQPFEYGEWRRAKVHIDYHISVAKSFYSVPYTLARQRVDVRVSASMVHVFSEGKLVASHLKLTKPNQFRTLSEHMPERHRHYVDRTAAGLQRRAKAIGESTLAVVIAQLARKEHPEVSYRSCLGILRLAQDYSPTQLEAACTQGLSMRVTNWRGIHDLIRAGRAGETSTPAAIPTIHHDNIRGKDYFQPKSEVQHAY